MSRTVKLESLKDFARRELLSYPITHEFILKEPDAIPIEEFALKSRMWLQLLDVEVRSRQLRQF